MENDKINTGNFFSVCWINVIAVMAFNSLSLMFKDFSWTQLVIDMLFLAMIKYCYDHGVKIEADIIRKKKSNEDMAGGDETEFLQRVITYYRTLVIGYCVYYIADGIARWIIPSSTTDHTSAMIALAIAYCFRKDYPSAKKKAAEKSVP
ncbi:MAG: hypothetical protein AB1916_05340 [Thermodesulfobacteriota bacterium]